MSVVDMALLGASFVKEFMMRNETVTYVVVKVFLKE